MNLLDLLLDGTRANKYNAAIMEEVKKAAIKIRESQQKIKNSEATNEVCEALKKKDPQICRVYSDRVYWQDSTSNGLLYYNDLGYCNIGEFRLMSLDSIKLILSQKYISKRIREVGMSETVDILYGKSEKFLYFPSALSRECGIPVFHRHLFVEDSLYYVCSERYLLAKEINQRVMPYARIDSKNEAEENGSLHDTTLSCQKILLPTAPKYKGW